MKAFKPMLASPCKSWASIRYPILASPKLDGFRCLIRDGVPVSRNFEPLRNRFVRSILTGLPPLDGELVVGEPIGKDVWNRSSAVMSEKHEPNFVFFVFDLVGPQPYAERYKAMRAIVEQLDNPRIQALEHLMVNGPDELERYEATAVAQGFEGVMLRALRGPYKSGRSTENEGYLMKVKRTEDYEAVIVEAIEQKRNANPATIDALGRTKRSTSKMGMIGTDSLGAFTCQMNGITFEIGAGGTRAERDALWKERDKLPGTLITFKCQGLTPDGKPRFPIFKGFRDRADLS